MSSLESRVEKALSLAYKYGELAGSHHKQWIIDQMVQALTGDEYEAWVEKYNFGDEGPDTFIWEGGTEP